MNREIKFRAWNMPFGPKGTMQEMVHGKASSILALAEMSPDEYIVEQFTGLKDKNGDDIYENDLVSLEPDDSPYKVILDKLKFEMVGNGVTYDLSEVHMDCVIVGSVHANPELLEAQHE